MEKLNWLFPVGIYFETLENGVKICSNLTIKTPEQHQGRRCDFFIVNLEQISLKKLMLSGTHLKSDDNITITFAFLKYFLKPKHIIPASLNSI